MLSMDELLKILKDGSFKNEEFICTYGTGRIETYHIDKHCMSGYDSSGNWKNIPLDSEEFEETEIRSISKVTQVWPDL